MRETAEISAPVSHCAWARRPSLIFNQGWRRRW